jgi:hypothetical protein
MPACWTGAGQDSSTSPTSSHVPPRPTPPPPEANTSATPTTFAARRLSRRCHMDRRRGRSFPINRVRVPRGQNAVPPPVNPLQRDLGLLDKFCEAPTCICTSCNRRMYRDQVVRPRVGSMVRTLLKLKAIMSMSCI